MITAVTAALEAILLLCITGIAPNSLPQAPWNTTSKEVYYPIGHQENSQLSLIEIYCLHNSLMLWLRKPRHSCLCFHKILKMSLQQFPPNYQL